MNDKKYDIEAIPGERWFPKRHPLKKTWVYIGETGASIQKWTN